MPPARHQVGAHQARGRHCDLMDYRIICDLPQEAGILEHLQLRGNTRRRIGKPQLLRLLWRAVTAQIYKRSHERAPTLIQQQEPFRKTNIHEYPHSIHIVVVDCGPNEPLWDASDGTAKTVSVHG